MMNRTVLLDCPHCGNVEDKVVTLDNPGKVGPFKHKCDDCNHDYIYTIEIDVQVSVFPCTPETGHWIKK